MAYLEGEIYALGGRYYGKEKDGVLTACEKYNLTTNKWQTIAPMNEKRCTSTCLAFKGNIYIFGGYSGIGRHKTIEKYDPNINSWTIIQLQLAFGVEAGISLNLNNDGYVAYIGGKDENKKNDSCTIYDLNTMKLISTHSILHGRVLPKCALYNNTIYVIGGHGTTWEKGDMN